MTWRSRRAAWWRSLGLAVSLSLAGGVTAGCGGSKVSDEAQAEALRTVEAAAPGERAETLLRLHGAALAAFYGEPLAPALAALAGGVPVTALRERVEAAVRHPMTDLGCEDVLSALPDISGRYGVVVNMKCPRSSADRLVDAVVADNLGPWRVALGIATEHVARDRGVQDTPLHRRTMTAIVDPYRLASDDIVRIDARGITHNDQVVARLVCEHSECESDSDFANAAHTSAVDKADLDEGSAETYFIPKLGAAQRAAGPNRTVTILAEPWVTYRTIASVVHSVARGGVASTAFGRARLGLEDDATTWPLHMPKAPVKRPAAEPAIEYLTLLVRRNRIDVKATGEGSDAVTTSLDGGDDQLTRLARHLTTVKAQNPDLDTILIAGESDTRWEAVEAVVTTARCANAPNPRTLACPTRFDHVVFVVAE